MYDYLIRYEQLLAFELKRINLSTYFNLNSFFIINKKYKCLWNMKTCSIEKWRLSTSLISLVRAPLLGYTKVLMKGITVKSLSKLSPNNLWRKLLNLISLLKLKSECWKHATIKTSFITLIRLLPISPSLLPLNFVIRVIWNITWRRRKDLLKMRLLIS